MADRTYTYKIPNTHDSLMLQQAKDAFLSLCDEYSDPSGSFVLLGKSYSIDRENLDELDQAVDRLSGKSGYYIDSLSITLHVQSTNDNPARVLFSIKRQGNDPTALLELKIPGNLSDDQSHLDLIEGAVDKFRPYKPLHSVLAGNDSDVPPHITALEQQLQKLSNLSLEQTERVTESLRQQAIENNDLLRGERERLDKEIAARYAELEQKEKDLDERVAAADYADAKVSRRKIREQIKEKLDHLAQELKLTKETNRDRYVLYIGIWVGMVVGLVVAFQALTSFSLSTGKEPYELAFLALRVIAGSLLFGGLLVYFVRWQSAWVNSRTKEELRLMQTSLDVERASWVVETLVEFKNEGIQEVPHELLNATTRNLFAGVEDDEPRTSGDELLDLLKGSAEKVNLRLGDHEVVLDRKGVRNLS